MRRPLPVSDASGLHGAALVSGAGAERWDRRRGVVPRCGAHLTAPDGFVAALAGLGTAPDDVVHRDAGPLLRQTNRRLSGPTTRSQRYP